METRYQLLHTIYEIVKHDPQPHTYPCRPREIILRQMMDWNSIHSHLVSLQNEELVTMRQLDTLVVCITEAGIEKIKASRDPKKILQ